MKSSEFKKNLTTLILCGGRGERLKPITNKIPKPLIKIDKKEILSYILSHLITYQVNNCIVLTGYKHKLIHSFLKKNFKKKIDCLYTGQKTDIIKRIKKSLKYAKKFVLLCYGDTLLDLNVNKLIKFHQKINNVNTMTIFEASTDFGVVEFNSKNLVTKFSEKPNLNLWINVGYFIFERDELIKLCNRFSSFKSLLNFLGKKSRIKAFKHNGKHITINSAIELEDAKKKIKAFKKVK